MWLHRREKNPEEGQPVTPDTDLHRLLDLNPCFDKECARYDNSAVRAVLKRNPDAAAARYDFAGESQRWRQYPLRRAVALGASLDVVRRMAAAHPDAIRERGAPGMSGLGATVLHAACTFGASLEIVRFLTMRYSEALDMTTKHGYLPLHTACERGASADVVRFLVEMHPAALDRRNKLGQTPAECALRAKGGTNEEAMAALAYAPPATMRVRRSFEVWPRVGWSAGKKHQWRRNSWGGSQKSVRTSTTQGLNDSRSDDGVVTGSER